MDVDAVTNWLAASLDDFRPPYDFALIAAGGSNLTYRVVDAEGRAVALRRPPEGPTLHSAHDIDREWRVMTALARTASVPVPACLARCDDTTVTGSPFYVMEFVDGMILRTRGDGERLDEARAARATASLVARQVAFHTLDLEEVGLADLGRHDSYVARQLKRWVTQVDRAATRDLPIVGEVHDALADAIPPERAAPALVHGDYRFDNVIISDTGEVIAILDWELATTGDPIADFVWSLQYWGDPDDEMWWLPDPPTVAAAFPRRREVAATYTAGTGFDLSDFAFYEAFSWWKQACIVEGAYGRRLRGSGGGMASQGSVDRIARRADQMLAHARTLVRSLGEDTAP